ncbi:hypothetical protein BGX26_009635 [Mortierella sp. AD094]|nr:hypothetical protein BGX26_009635 [Mortierella sp. AD094]
MLPHLPSSIPGAISISLALTFTLTLTLTHAQSTTIAPIPVSGPAFARTATRLYISGGMTGTSTNPVVYKQFFSLDLAVPWNASAPAWKQLHDGPQQNIFPAVFSADQKTMITFHSGTPFANRYSVDQDQWTPSQLVVQGAGNQGVNAVTDPTTGLVYLAGGYSDPYRQSMDTYSFVNDALVQTALPLATVAFPNRAYYSNIWTSKRKSILYFGGYNSTLAPVSSNTITEFVPSTNSWTTVITTNNGPSMRSDHCMTVNDDGSTMVIFGGRPYTGSYSGEVFIFDTVGQSWSQGVSGPPRIYAACTIAGDNLIVWGGVDSYDAIASPAMMIYSLTNKTWITQYTPPASYLTASPTPSANGQSGGGSSNAGAIAGGVVGGIAVICAIVLFLLFKRRQHRPKPIETEDTSDYKSSGGGSHEEELQSMRAQLQSQQEQLELQRRLFEAQQNQQQYPGPFQLQLPQQQLHHQYQEVPYTYQPPIVYAASNSTSPHAVTTPGITTDSAGIVPISSEFVHSGYVDGGSRYVDTPTPVPVVYAPPPNLVAPVKVPASKDRESDLWEDRTPGNPHAIIET